MYTPTQLAKMFNTSRTTIYNKLKHKTLHKFIIETEQGKQLLQEGLSNFQILMSKSKAHKNNINEQQANCKDNNSLNDSYIGNLKQQINDLKKDKENLIEDKNKLMDDINKKSSIIEKQLMLIEENQSKILLLTESNKTKSWWKFWQ